MEEQIKGNEKHIAADLRDVQPKVVGAVGRIAARWFLGDVDLDTVHGVPHFSARTSAVVIPIYHPAAGFYAPELAALSQDDLLRFAYYLRNPVAVRKKPKIRVRLHAQAPRGWIEAAAVDTEGSLERPWGLSWSTDGRTAHVWLWAHGKRLPRFRGRILFHHALHDLPILRAMGIDTSLIDPGDTMVRLFNLQLEPQGLKAAGYRHAGLKMEEFEEIVRPHFDAAAIKWMRKAAAVEYPKPEPVPVEDYGKKKMRLYRPQGVGRRIKNAITAVEKENGKPVKLEKRWAEIGASQWIDQTPAFQAQAEAAVGSPFPEFSLHLVPRKKAVKYSGTDAAATRLIDKPLAEAVAARGLSAVYEMDRLALPFIDRMQEVGMRVDREKLLDFDAELEGLRERAQGIVQSIVGDRWFNPGSGDQVAKWLYSYRGLPVLSYTDTGRGSTADAALQMLRGYHAQDPDVAAFLTGVQDYREADKLLGSFVRPMLKDIVRDDVGDWRIHWGFKATRVVSGRLAGRLLTIPVRTELGRKLRFCFIAREGYVIVDADLSQLELRVGAHYSGDRRMRRAFENGEDLHALTASILFRLVLEAVDKEGPERYVAKTINFATFYGISARALLEQLYAAGIFDYTLEDCERFIRDWFGAFGSVRRWQKALTDQAIKDGFVRTMWGRMCYVPNLRVMDDRLRESAERLSRNFPVQGSGSDATKRGEIRLHDWIEENGLREAVRPMLQMHDEIVLETRKDLADEVRGVLEMIMTADQRRFNVPIKAKAKIGGSWGAAKG
jgi:DNA polymerase I-like protein with 3'-5' exonuclease and polymerase domains